MLSSFLSSLGLHSKEQEIYIALVRHGHSTASQIASYTERERTSTFKLMMSLHHKGFLTMSGSGNSRLFAAVELDILHKQFQTQLNNLNALEQDFGMIEKIYSELQSPHQHRPNVELYEGTLGIQKAYQHILKHLQDKKLIYCHCIASKTFESLAHSNLELQQLNSNFVNQLQKSSIRVHGLYAHGMSLMESLLQSSHYHDTLDLPTTDNAIQVWVTGDLVTTFIMKKNPQIIQITSHELAMLWMFLAEQLGK